MTVGSRARVATQEKASSEFNYKALLSHVINKVNRTESIITASWGFIYNMRLQGKLS